MPLAAGSRIGPFEVAALLGAGGMGEVWRARDARLGRDVAIKALPEAFARDPDRVARFEREARLLASLSHPNIAAILGLEEAAGQRYLVLEYVEGPTLAERLRPGPLPLDEALDVCRQIAAAVEAAHESGVVHRDLKPGNVKLTPAGAVKVLDFGLAKSGAATTGSSDPSLSASPTLTYAATEAGVILGTAAYMSPEQARGKQVDRRTDIWSFGCVLYECLTGRPLYRGETVSDLIAQILEREPDWRALPAGLPPRVRELLRRCLEKDARRRLRDIGEARLALEDAGAPAPADRAAAPRERRAPPGWLGWAVAALIAAVSAVVVLPRALERSAPRAALRSVVVGPPGAEIQPDGASIALSADGRRLAMVLADSTRLPTLWVRALDGYETRRLEGTQDATLPFWSPDGRAIGFFADGKLRRVPADGGAVDVVCDARNGRGATWNRDGTIVFAPEGAGPLFRVPAEGGTPVAVTVLDSTRGETAHRAPCFLPDGRHFLYVALPRRGEGMDVRVGSLDDPRARRVLFQADGAPVYAAPGALVFVRNGHVVAQGFDAARLALRGPAVPLDESPAGTNASGMACVTASATGAFACVVATPASSQMVWLGRDGRRSGALPIPAGRYEEIALAPDGSAVAVVQSETSSRSDLWLADPERGTLRRFTFGPGQNNNVVWSPDSRRVMFRSNRNGPFDLYVKSVAGTGSETLVYHSPVQFKEPSSWSSDGRWAFFGSLDARTGWDLWQVSMTGDSAARPVLATRFNERFPVLSPDGRWLLYSSDESGRFELYSQSFPDGEERHQISVAGSFGGLWRSDGGEVLFVSLDLSTMLGAEVDVTRGFHVGQPRVLLRLPPNMLAPTFPPDLSRVLVLLPTGSDAPPVIHLVADWPALMDRASR